MFRILVLPVVSPEFYGNRYPSEKRFYISHLAFQLEGQADQAGGARGKTVVITNRAANRNDLPSTVPVRDVVDDC
jgi:hypothetical protein